MKELKLTQKKINELAAATLLQATFDYFECERLRKGEMAAKEKQKILDDLRSDWMVWFTDDQSLVVAEQLEKNPDAIRDRLKKSVEYKKTHAGKKQNIS